MCFFQYFLLFQLDTIASVIYFHANNGGPFSDHSFCLFFIESKHINFIAKER